MNVPYINCFACYTKIEGPFEPPDKLPPDVCPKCGECPTFKLTKEDVEALLASNPFLKGMLEKVEHDTTPSPTDSTIDLVKKVEQAYEMAKNMMPKEQAGVSVASGLSEALWTAWRMTDKWKHHRGMLN